MSPARAAGGDPGKGSEWWRERITVVHAEAAPGAMRGEVHTHHRRGPAVLFADGTGGHAWRGTPIPAWVIHGPTIERISMERDVEVRRCAIGRIGWDVCTDRRDCRLSQWPLTRDGRAAFDVTIRRE